MIRRCKVIDSDRADSDRAERPYASRIAPSRRDRTLLHPPTLRGGEYRTKEDIIKSKREGKKVRFHKQKPC